MALFPWDENAPLAESAIAVVSARLPGCHPEPDDPPRRRPSRPQEGPEINSRRVDMVVSSKFFFSEMKHAFFLAPHGSSSVDVSQPQSRSHISMHSLKHPAPEARHAQPAPSCSSNHSECCRQSSSANRFATVASKRSTAVNPALALVPRAHTFCFRHGRTNCEPTDLDRPKFLLTPSPTEDAKPI